MKSINKLTSLSAIIQEPERHRHKKKQSKDDSYSEVRLLSIVFYIVDITN